MTPRGAGFRAPAARSFHTRARVPALILVSLCCLAYGSEDATANQKVCGNLEQHYEQIARGASSVEISNAPFSATDKGCQALAFEPLEHFH